MSTALFAVDRGGSIFHVSADNVGHMKPMDKVVVQRGDTVYHATYRAPGTSEPWPTIADTDLLATWHDDETKHVTGAEFKSLFPKIPDGKVAIEVRFIDNLDASQRYLSSANTEAVYPFVTAASGVNKFLPDIAPDIDNFEKFVVPKDDVPSGYVFIGDPKTFKFAHNSQTFDIHMEFGPFTDTSLWENDNSVFSNLRYCFGGCKYIDTSKFTSLSNVFAKNANRTEIDLETALFESYHDWEGMVNWNTSNVTNFAHALKGVQPDTPKMNWDFSKAEDCKYLFGTHLGVPKWVEDIQFGPNLNDLYFAFNHYKSGKPSGADGTDQYYGGQERPLDLSKWDVRNISSMPRGFFTTNPFQPDATASWVILPNWGTTGG